MATVTQIREGIATRLQTISGLMVQARLRGSVNSHTAIVRPADPAITYAVTMGPDGSDDHRYLVTVVVGLADQGLAQEQLDPYLDRSGTKSIKAAVEGDESLGGIVSFARVAACTEYGDIEIGGVEYLGASFDIEVTT